MPSGPSTLNRDQIAERGARMARRDDREYREYLREEQRRQPGCPAREVVLDQRGRATGAHRTITAKLALRCFIVMVLLLALGQAGPVRAQAPLMERMTFDEAVARALARNPSLAEAATAILRAEALLQQSRAATRPNVSASVTNVLINEQVGFEGIVAQPQNQTFFGISAGMPVLAAAQWAATTQARDQIEVARLSVAEVRRQIAVSTAQAYLAVITAARQVEVNRIAIESGQAHLDYAQRRLAAGAGTRLNELRAAQVVSADEARLEIARLAVRRAQEALGVLTASSGPVDVNGEPIFETPAVSVSPDNDTWLTARPDIQFSMASLAAAERVVRDSSKDWYPHVTASLDPQLVAPAGSFSRTGAWSFSLRASQPIFDSGQRKAAASLREAAAESSRQALASVQIDARSEARLAEETVRSTERTLTSLQLTAMQAAEVLTISSTAFEAGATTNLEVIDAQRTAREAASAAAVAEDAVRRAKLDLLVALGRFPR